MSSSSRPIRNRHLLVGLEGLTVGTLTNQQLKQGCRIWQRGQLASKGEAGIPEDVIAVHVLENVDGRLVNVLRAAARAVRGVSVKFFEPVGEELLEARLRPMLGLPLLVPPQVNCVHNPVGYHKGLAVEAMGLVGKAEKEALDALHEWDREAAACAALSDMVGRLQLRNRRLELLRRARRSLRIALSMSSGREIVEIPPERFQQDWEEQCRQLLDAREEIRKLCDKIGVGNENARERGVRQSTLTKAQGRVKELERQLKGFGEKYADLEKLVEERGATIRELRNQLDAREAATPVVAKKPKEAKKSLAKPAANKRVPKIPKFGKLADLADWLLGQDMLNEEQLAEYAEAQGFKYKDPKAVIRYATARRDMRGQ